MSGTVECLGCFSLQQFEHMFPPLFTDYFSDYQRIISRHVHASTVICFVLCSLRHHVQINVVQRTDVWILFASLHGENASRFSSEVRAEFVRAQDMFPARFSLSRQWENIRMRSVHVRFAAAINVSAEAES